ncbi:hypothetical protein D3C85_1907260 [compost metagenome]
MAESVIGEDFSDRFSHITRIERIEIMRGFAIYLRKTGGVAANNGGTVVHRF